MKNNSPVVGKNFKGVIIYKKALSPIVQCTDGILCFHSNFKFMERNHL